MKFAIISIFLIVFSIFNYRCNAQIDTCWTVNKLDNPSPGYIKLGQNSGDGFYLMDNYGVKQYALGGSLVSLSMAQKLLKNGFWICFSETGNGTKKYYILNQSLQIIDSIPISSTYDIDLHDVNVLSNGHYLILYVELIKMDMSKIVSGGDPNADVMNNVLVETDRTGNVFWEWKSLDHLKITDVTSDIDLKQPGIDFSHINSFSETKDGNILISFRNLDEITKVNKATGKVMWRFGGELCKNNQFTFLNDEINGFKGFSHQHSVSELSNGNILVFDNGNLKPNPYSRAVEYSLDTINHTALKVWEYRYSPDILSDAMGSAERLPNGNTLINWTHSKITEVKPDKSIVYEYSYKCGPFGNGLFYRVNKHITMMNAVTLSLPSAGTYIFADQKYNTDITLVLSSITGSGTTTIEKHNYEPPRAIYSDSSFSEIVPARWVITKSGLTNISGTIKFKISGITGLAKPSKAKVYKRDKETTGTFLPLTTTYNSSTGEISASFSGFGELVLASFALSTPILTLPSNQSVNIPVGGTLKWQKTNSTTKYQMQVSTSTGFSPLTIDNTINATTEFPYTNLKYNTKYYWRIRAINSIDTSAWSTVFSFTTQQIQPPELLYPSNSKIGFQVNDSLTWKKVTGAEKYGIQISVNSDFSAVLIDTNSIIKESFSLKNLKYNSKYYWRAKATQGTNVSQWSAAFSFTTTLQPPKLTYPTDDTTGQPLEGKLYWNSVAGSVSYELEISTFQDFRVLLVPKVKITQTNFEYKFLEANTIYYWRVRACRVNDTSYWSSAYKFRTKLVAPKLSFPPDNAIKIPLKTLFLWDTITTADSYRIQLASVNNFSKLLLDSIDLPKCSFQADGLPAESRLYWRVTARYGDAYGEWSEVRVFTTGSILPLETPILVSPENNTKKYINGELKWNKVEGAETYHLQMSTDSLLSIKIEDRYGITSNSFPYSSLSYKTRYFWRVRAVNNTDTSAWSENHTFITQSDKPKLIYPQNELTQVPVDIELRWSDSLEADYLLVQLSIDSLFVSTLLDSTVLNTNTCSVKNLGYNTDYYWRARYNKDGNWSNWSVIYHFTTSTEFVLSTPELTSPDDNAYGVPIDGFLKWEPVENAKTYRATISYNAEFDDVFVRKLGVVGTEFSYSGLDYNHLYYWRITAFNDTASGHWSQIRVFTTELRQPIGFFPANNSESIPISGLITWSASEAAKLYRLQISTDAEFGNNNQEFITEDDTNFNYTLMHSTIYYWRVKAETNLNTSRWSQVNKFTTEPSADVADLGDKSGVFIYPMPSTNILHLFGKDFSGCHYEILSIEGIPLVRSISGSNSIDISKLAPGCYYLRIDNINLKFIKI